MLSHNNDIVAVTLYVTLTVIMTTITMIMINGNNNINYYYYYYYLIIANYYYYFMNFKKYWWSFVDRNILVMLQHSLSHPYLTHCNIAQESNYSSKFIPLLQIRIICIMFCLHPCARTKDFFISNGFLNNNNNNNYEIMNYQINKFLACLFIFNYEHCELAAFIL